MCNKQKIESIQCPFVIYVDNILILLKLERYIRAVINMLKESFDKVKDETKTLSQNSRANQKGFYRYNKIKLWYAIIKSFTSYHKYIQNGKGQEDLLNNKKMKCFHRAMAQLLYQSHKHT
jgi:hypothetical protein